MSYESFDTLERKMAAASISLAIDGARIPDVMPYGIKSSHRQIIMSRGAIDGSYFIDTSLEETPHSDAPIERQPSSQTFGIVSDHGEVELIKYENDDEGPRLSVNRQLLSQIDVDDISVFDLTEFDEMADLIFGLECGYLQPDEIKDSPYSATLMQIAIKWVMDKKSLSQVEREYSNYIFEVNGDLLTITTTRMVDGSKRDRIVVTNDDGRSLPEVTLFKDSEGEIDLESPIDRIAVALTTNTIVDMIENGTLIH